MTAGFFGQKIVLIEKRSKHCFECLSISGHACSYPLRLLHTDELLSLERRALNHAELK